MTRGGAGVVVSAGLMVHAGGDGGGKDQITGDHTERQCSDRAVEVTSMGNHSLTRTRRNCNTAPRDRQDDRRLPYGNEVRLIVLKPTSL